MTVKLHKNALKLSGLYLAIIMAISVFFSITVYQLTLNEINRGLNGGAIQMRRLGPGFSREVRDALLQERRQQADTAKSNIINRLVLTNLAIVIGGGLLSYYLAVRTLRPIERAAAARDRFTADASHELRTPITALITENEVSMIDRGLSVAEAKKQFASNVEELNRLSRLTDGLLRLSGLDNQELLKEDFDLVSAARSAIERAQTSAEKKSITIDPTMPKSIHVHGDADSMQEAIYILLDNAVKYSHDKSTVRLQLQRHKNSVEIIVKDSGIGIAAGDLPHIFERFYRADSSRTKQQSSGYGIGLAIAKDIVEKHGGHIEAQSVVGKGTTLTIVL